MTGTRLKILMLRTRYPHWGEHTAFNVFPGCFDERRIELEIRQVPMDGGTPFWRLWFFMFRMLIRRAGLASYGVNDLAAEFLAFRSLRERPVQIVHFLDAEHGCLFLPRWIRKLGRPPLPRVAATYHQPPSILRTIVRPSVATAVDHVLTVSPHQQEFFSRVLPAGKISTIPLGVDTDYFRPRPAGPDDGIFRCLAGGIWLRDYPVILETARRLPEIRFQLVAPRRHFATLPGNVECFEQISDSRLRELYQDASLLFLPLEDATANTFLMEGAACGLPILSTALPGVRWYFPGEEAVLIEGGKADAFEDVIRQLATDRNRLRRMRELARRRAETYAWPLIARQYEELYHRLAMPT